MSHSRRVAGADSAETTLRTPMLWGVASASPTGSPWLLVAGLFGHGLNDLWQHRTEFVTGMRWWPPFWMAVDWVVAAIIVVEIASGVDFR